MIEICLGTQMNISSDIRRNGRIQIFKYRAVTICFDHIGKQRQVQKKLQIRQGTDSFQPTTTKKDQIPEYFFNISPIAPMNFIDQSILCTWSRSVKLSRSYLVLIFNAHLFYFINNVRQCSCVWNIYTFAFFSCQHIFAVNNHTYQYVHGASVLFP